MAFSELREVYRALQTEHTAMRAQLDASMRTFKREFKRCRPEDEVALAAKFAAILEALRASVAAAGPIAAEKLESL
jgi:hypothetical protein